MGKDRSRLDGWLRDLPPNFFFHEVGIVGDRSKIGMGGNVVELGAWAGV
jgi:hypothetical protein